MQRVMILGSAGSGKSTLARAIGARTGLPVVHLDSLFWKPGWVEPTPEEFVAKHDAAVAADRWVIDGNYSRLFGRRLASADTVIVFDLPRMTCMRGILWRWLKHRGTTRPDMPVGCPEKIDWAFIKWVWNFRERSRDKQLTLAESLRATKSVHVFRSRREAYRWLDGVPLDPRR
jgi:adenylate kinase family enzyme